MSAPPLPLSALEEAQLRRLVFRAFALRSKPGYREALEAIEAWHVETLPDRIVRSSVRAPSAPARRRRG